MGRIAERLRPGPLLILVRKLVVALRPAAALSWLSLQIRLQTDRWFNWYPVAFATGVGVYFFLPREPHMAIFIAAGLLVALFLIRLSASGHRLAMVLAMVFLAGFAGAKLRTSLVAPKVLVASTPTVQIAGKVISMEHYGKKRARFLLRLTSSSEVKPEALPKIVRITGRAPKQMFLSGDSISLKARLFALPTPVQPGGFDFGRKLWFEGVGATGFFYGDVKHLVGKNAASGQGGFFHAATRFIQKIRYDIAARIKAVLAEGIYKWNLSSDQTASVAIALITGDRGGLDKQTSQQLRRAGLAHILAISGLHMSLVAGGMFWLVRALLALFPALAMNYPIKKWAAIA
ncbi:MAG TPA: DUF4131 domain-containing protein, partial [Rhizobiales bacterium]|nr:DUF4131 domain-containing protein [Hyphomicrobiales bacterium]